MISFRFQNCNKYGKWIDWQCWQLLLMNPYSIHSYSNGNGDRSIQHIAFSLICDWYLVNCKVQKMIFGFVFCNFVVFSFSCSFIHPIELDALATASEFLELPTSSIQAHTGLINNWHSNEFPFYSFGMSDND